MANYEVAERWVREVQAMSWAYPFEELYSFVTKLSQCDKLYPAVSFTEPINRTETIKLAGGFMKDVDPMYGFMFQKALLSGRIQEGERDYAMRNEMGITVYFKPQGTVQDASGIVHEFFHYLNPNSIDSEKHPLGDFPSIYADYLFSDYLIQEKGNQPEFTHLRLARMRETYQIVHLMQEFGSIIQLGFHAELTRENVLKHCGEEVSHALESLLAIYEKEDTNPFIEAYQCFSHAFGNILAIHFHQTRSYEENKRLLFHVTNNFHTKTPSEFLSSLGVKSLSDLIPSYQKEYQLLDERMNTLEGIHR